MARGPYQNTESFPEGPLKVMRKGPQVDKENTGHGDSNIISSRLASSSFELPPAKRRKAAPLPVSLERDENDDIDELGISQTTLMRSAPGYPTPTRVSSSKSLLSMSALPHNLTRSRSSEYKTLEKMMDSYAYRKNQDAMMHKISISPNSISASQGLPVGDPITLERRERPTYRGTARPATAMRNSVLINRNLDDTGVIHNRSTPISAVSSKPSQRPEGPVEHRARRPSSNFQNSFVSRSGRPRNSDTAISSDELADTGSHDYDTVVRVPTTTQSGGTGMPHASPVMKKAILDEISDPDDHGDIKPSKFVDSHPCIRHTETTKKDHRRRSNGFTALRITKVLMNGCLNDEAEMSVGLTDAKYLDIYIGNTNQSPYRQSSRLSLKKLNKIEWAPECPMVHLESSKYLKYGGKSLFEFTSERDAWKFVDTLLRSPTTHGLVQGKKIDR